MSEPYAEFCANVNCPSCLKMMAGYALATIVWTALSQQGL